MFESLKKIFFNYKKSDKYREQLIRVLKVEAAELAVFKDSEAKRLLAKLSQKTLAKQTINY